MKNLVLDDGICLKKKRIELMVEMNEHSTNVTVKGHDDVHHVTFERGVHSTKENTERSASVNIVRRSMAFLTRHPHIKPSVSLTFFVFVCLPRHRIGASRL